MRRTTGMSVLSRAKGNRTSRSQSGSRDAMDRREQLRYTARQATQGLALLQPVNIITEYAGRGGRRRAWRIVVGSVVVGVGMRRRGASVRVCVRPPELRAPVA